MPKKKTQATTPARLRARMTPGAMLRTLRTLQEMTQAQVAAVSGVPQPAIFVIESGRSELGADRARRLAVALHVHPAVLLFPDWEPTELNVASGS